jgi:superfamily II DNA or RNA helicase
VRTYGKLRFRQEGPRGVWLLDLEPQVRIRAKRVFGSLAKAERGVLSISATPGNSRDVEWFTQRFPLQVDDPDRLDLLARRFDSAMSAVQGVLTGSADLPTFDLAVPARAYQRGAADIVLKTGRLLLGDDLGLGKTASAICVLSDARARPAVVVTLTHLPGQWAAELAKFAPQLHVLIPKKGTPTPREMERLTGMFRPDVIVLNYAKLAGWGHTLIRVYQPKSVVFDEVQELRTGTGSQRGAAAAEVAASCAFRMGLSATPVYNYGGEIYSILNTLDPGCLGTRTEFNNEWTAGMDGDKVKDPVALGLHLRDVGLMLRRTKADVRDEVPELDDPIRIPHLIEADASTIADAENGAAELARIILSDASEGSQRSQASIEIDWRMRQATGIAKAPFVAAFVRMLLEEEERVLLFGWHHAVYSLWHEALADFSPVLFSGKQSTEEKAAAKAKFLDGQSRVLIMSLRSGAGLDGLQSACRCVVFGELDWSPGVHDQCLGRIHRPRQKDTVRAFYLHADMGADPIMVDVLGVKNAQARGIRDPLAPNVENVADTRDRIRRLAEACLARSRGGREVEPSPAAAGGGA